MHICERVKVVLNRTDGGSHGRDGDPIVRASLQSASHAFIYISCEPQVVLIKEHEHRDDIYARYCSFPQYAQKRCFIIVDLLPRYFATLRQLFLCLSLVIVRSDFTGNIRKNISVYVS